jgi:MerR family Zn(II)-responsive transcriptional regulator of zntA
MRISELAGVTGTTPKTLRFYEDIGLLRPATRTPSGYRDFDSDVIDRLDFIRRGQAAGLTLAQVMQILQIRDRGQPPCEHVRELLATRLADLDSQIAQLLELRETIARLGEAAAHSAPESCAPNQICRYL